MGGLCANCTYCKNMAWKNIEIKGYRHRYEYAGNTVWQYEVEEEKVNFSHGHKFGVYTNSVFTLDSILSSQLHPEGS